MTTLAIAGLGTTELLIILAVIILLFGASKLPELARGSGRALRIFKAETKGLNDDDDDDDATSHPRAARAPGPPGRGSTPTSRRTAERARAPRRHHRLTAPDVGFSSAVSRACCAARRSTPSGPTGGWRSPTTCASCAPG